MLLIVEKLHAVENMRPQKKKKVTDHHMGYILKQGACGGDVASTVIGSKEVTQYFLFGLFGTHRRYVVSLHFLSRNK